MSHVERYKTAEAVSILVAMTGCLFGLSTGSPMLAACIITASLLAAVFIQLIALMIANKTRRRTYERNFAERD